MQKLFHSGLTVIVNSGFVYFPLLFDPSIQQEVIHRQAACAVDTGPSELPQISRESKLLILHDGKLFVRGLTLRSLRESYPGLFPDDYEQLKRCCLERNSPAPEQAEMMVDKKLEIILFHVLPHFFRRKKGLRRGKPSTGEILDLIGETVSIPEEFYEHADQFPNNEELEKALGRLGNSHTDITLSDGPVSARKLHEWVREELTARMLDEEKKRLHALIQERHRFIKVHRRYIATLLFMQQRGFFEKDGAGFYRDEKSRDYVIYKRTGEYALKDYFARIYLFPDCRVAVRTYGHLKPVVLEKYKHPFLQRHTSNQAICLGEPSGPPVEFSADNAIKTIEDGINALFYGYNSRKRNGHHSLDRSTTYFRAVDFDDYLISEDHPKIISGEVEVKNAFK